MRKATKRATSSIAALADQSLAELRAEWQRRYGPPPKHRAADLLRRVLAWRIQADIYGGLDAPTRRMLEPEQGQVKVSPTPGMRLAREWAGRRHEVVVIESGGSTRAAPTAASPRSPATSPASDGMARASSACVRPICDDQGQNPLPLRDLYPQIERGGTGATVQLSRCATGSLRSLYPQPSWRGLGMSARSL